MKTTITAMGLVTYFSLGCLLFSQASGLPPIGDRTGVRLVHAGNKAADEGKWDIAKADYQQAVTYQSGYEDGIYGLGRCAAEANDLKTAIRYYRRAIYGDDTVQAKIAREGDPRINDTDPVHVLEYSILLTKAGLYSEALYMYHEAITPIDSTENSKGDSLIAVPDYGPDNPPTQYTDLLAFAHIEIAVHDFRENGGRPNGQLKDLTAALDLAPQSIAINMIAAAQYKDRGMSAEAKTAYERARQLDDGTHAKEIDAALVSIH